MKTILRVLLNYVLGPVLFIWFAIAIFYQIKEQPNLQVSWRSLQHIFSWRSVWVWALVFLFMLCNWGIEALKWKIILRHIETISFLKAYGTIIMSQALAVITPNRLGEHAGRIAHLKPANRLAGLTVSIVHGFSQLLTTLLLGAGGLWAIYFFLPDFINAFPVVALRFTLAVLIAITIAVVFCIWLYYHLTAIMSFVKILPFVKKWIVQLEQIETMERRILTQILLLSILRLFIFSTQYLLLFAICDVQLIWWQGMCLLCVLFFAIAIVPSFTIAEIGVRGQLCLLLFGLVSTNALGIVTVATAIWFINLVLPSIIGSFFVLRLRVLS